MRSLVLPAPSNRKRILSHSQTTLDIASGLQLAEYNSRIFAPALRQYFLLPNIKTSDLLKNIHSFYRDNIKYVKESPENQTVRALNKILWDGFGDCKHYAISIATTLSALQIPYYFRLTSYDRDNPTPTHVYIVLKNGYVLDGVLKEPGTEKPYVYKYDVSPLK